MIKGKNIAIIAYYCRTVRIRQTFVTYFKGIKLNLIKKNKVEWNGNIIY